MAHLADLPSGSSRSAVIMLSVARTLLHDEASHDLGVRDYRWSCSILVVTPEPARQRPLQGLVRGAAQARDRR